MEKGSIHFTTSCSFALALRRFRKERLLASSHLSLCQHGTCLPLDEFHKIRYQHFFRKYDEKVQVQLVSDKNDDYIT
jgi:DNA polymerase/3'-5' exonuclease PolX